MFDKTGPSGGARCDAINLVIVLTLKNKMTPKFFVANKSKLFRTNRGNLGEFARAYSLSRQISIVSSSGTLVN